MVTREAIVKAARGWLGTPYHHQASVKGIGSDCLGLIRGIWRELYGPEPEAMPAYTRDWGDATGSETLLEAACRHLVRLGDVGAAEPGDVLVFRMRDEGVAKHAGILTGASRLVHAQEGIGVIEIELGRWWRRRAAGAFQFPDVGCQVPGHPNPTSDHLTPGT
jgi:NlpC/P60 family putative phage cell wall peptidase